MSTSSATAAGTDSLTICCRIQFFTGRVNRLNQKRLNPGIRISQAGMISSTTINSVRPVASERNMGTSRRSMIR